MKYMASSVRLIQRYVWLVDVIRRAGSISLEEINHLWMNNSYLNDLHEYEIPERTFHRHKVAIFDIFGIEIVCERSSNTYSIKNAEILDRPSFTSWLFNGLSLNYMLIENENVRNQVIFEDTPEGNESLPIIIEGIGEKKVLSMTYRSFNNPKDTHWKVEPIGLKQYRRRWYMICRTQQGDKPLTFSLDRIKSLDLTDDTFDSKGSEDITGMFSEVLGVNLDDELDAEEIIVRVYGNQRQYFESVPLHSSQKLIHQTPDYSDYQFHLRPEYEFQHEILRLGNDAEVLSPQWVRNEMRSYAEAMLQRYSNQ